MRTRLSLLAMAIALIATGCNDPSSTDAPAESGSSAVLAPFSTPDEVGMWAVAGNFRALLSGEEGSTDSRGRGVATFQVSADGMSIRYRLVVANVEDVTMAHIHVAPTAAGSGPPAVWLYPDGPPPQLIAGPVNGIVAEGTFTAADLVDPFSGMSIADLVAMFDENRAYVNVHTEQHPGGEIRGQVR